MVKDLPANAGDVRDMGLIRGLGISPGEGNGWGNPMDRGAWWATVLGVPKDSDTTEQLNNNNNHHSPAKALVDLNSLFNHLSDKEEYSASKTTMFANVASR